MNVRFVNHCITLTRITKYEIHYGSELYPCRTYVAEMTEDFPDLTSLSIIRFKQKELEITGTKSLNRLN